jgi:phospholipid/cholesterol/gamma-HCH transport system ATP-binding protein
MALIELKDIHKRFGWQEVLNGVNLQIEKGTVVVILGASGSGKSVMLKHIVGLLKPDFGEVWFSGRRIDTLSESDLMKVRQNFGFLFQQGALFDSLNVSQNVGFPLAEHTDKKPEEIAEIAGQKLRMVGLAGIGNKMPGELSGGQRKRVALARAIALDPQVILYDEPTTGLDPIRSDVINELILKLQRELHVTSVVVTHDMNSAFKVADRLVMLYEGKLIFDGTSDEIRASTNEAVRRFVLGEASEQELQTLDSDGKR